jgi:hypothetical protein
VLYSISRYYNRLSAVLCSVCRYTATDYLPCSTLSSDTLYNRLSALLYLSMLQPTIRSTNSLLCCALSGDTTTDYPMCSTLSVDSTADYPIYRLSALICIVKLQPTVCSALLCIVILLPTICGTLLCLAMLQETICCTLPGDMFVGGLVCGFVGVSF